MAIARRVSYVDVVAVDGVAYVTAFHPAVGKTVEERFYQPVGQVVFRHTVLARVVAHGHFLHFPALERYERGQEAVHTVEERNAFGHVGVHYLERAAGVGGLVACHLAALGAKKVIATDISRPSLAKAVRLAEEFGVSDIVETRAGDGLDIVEAGESDVVIIAGMGGDTIAGIVSRAAEQDKAFAQYVLSPNTHPEKVRAGLTAAGYRITADAAVSAGGKNYTLIAAERGAESLDEMQLLFGKFFRTDESFPARASAEKRLLESKLGSAPAHSNARYDALVKALSEVENEN